MYLLDTNVCIYAMKNTYPQLTDKLFSLHPSSVTISAITFFELEYGAEKSNWGEKTRHMLAQFLAPFTILPFDCEDAIIAGKIRAYLEKQGNLIGPYDCQIAAQGIARKLVVVTHNTKEFARIPGIMLEDWVN